MSLTIPWTMSSWILRSGKKSSGTRELNQIWEAWLKVKTNRGDEAVMDSSRRERGAGGTREIMRRAFTEAFRVLKPGRWITIEFHNSSNVVWTAIQEAVGSAGFVVADVRTLNKMQETYKQSRQGLVKQEPRDIGVQTKRWIGGQV